MNKIAARIVGKHALAAHSVGDTPEARFYYLLKQCCGVRVAVMSFLFSDFEATVIAECRRQAGL